MSDGCSAAQRKDPPNKGTVLAKSESVWLLGGRGSCGAPGLRRPSCPPCRPPSPRASQGPHTSPLQGLGTGISFRLHSTTVKKSTGIVLPPSPSKYTEDPLGEATDMAACVKLVSRRMWPGAQALDCQWSARVVPAQARGYGIAAIPTVIDRLQTGG